METRAEVSGGEGERKRGLMDYWVESLVRGY